MSTTGYSEELASYMAAEGVTKPSYSDKPRPCAECGLQLRIGERKVHAGRCSRARELALQRRRRQAQRIARPEPAARAR
jgi:hypothetical protein